MTFPRNTMLALVSCILFLQIRVASAEVVVIVSAKNPLSSLTAEQASDIFLGQPPSFPNGVQAMPIDQAEGSALRDEFYSKTASKSPAQVKAYWSKIIFTGKGRPPREGGDSTAVRKQVADNPNAIGYADKSAVDSSVKVVLTVR